MTPIRDPCRRHHRKWFGVTRTSPSSIWVPEGTHVCVEGPRFYHKVSEHSVLVRVPRGPKTRHCCTILLAVVSGSNTHHGTSVTSISTYVYAITVENCRGVHQHSVTAPAQVMMMSRVPEAKERNTSLRLSVSYRRPVPSPTYRYRSILELVSSAVSTHSGLRMLVLSRQYK